MNMPTSKNIVRLPDGQELYNVEEIGPSGDALIYREHGQFDIAYTKEFDQFTVSIYGKDFSVTRTAAEEKFLTLVATGSIERACSLKVQIIPFAKAHPEISDLSYTLSFCTP